MNAITLMGRMVRDPELAHTTTGTAVTSFSIAVNRPKMKDKEQEVDFIDVVAWRHTAEFVTKYFAKGQMVALTGRLQIRDWTDKENNKRHSAEVVADEIFFADSKKTA